MGLSICGLALAAALGWQGEETAETAPPAGEAPPSASADAASGEARAPAVPRAYRFALAANPGPIAELHHDGAVFTVMPGRLELEYAMTPSLAFYLLPEVQISAQTSSQIAITLYPRVGVRYYLTSSTLDGFFVSSDLGAFGLPTLGTPAPTTVSFGGVNLYLEGGYGIRLSSRIVIAVAAGTTVRAIAWSTQQPGTVNQPVLFRSSVRITPTFRF